MRWQGRCRHRDATAPRTPSPPHSTLIHIGRRVGKSCLWLRQALGHQDPAERAGHGRNVSECESGSRRCWRAVHFDPMAWPKP